MGPLWVIEYITAPNLSGYQNCRVLFTEEVAVGPALDKKKVFSRFCNIVMACIRLCIG